MRVVVEGGRVRVVVLGGSVKVVVLGGRVRVTVWHTPRLSRRFGLAAWAMRAVVRRVRSVIGCIVRGGNWDRSGV